MKNTSSKKATSLKKELVFHNPEIAAAALALDIIDHPLRQKILHFIHKKKIANVRLIYKALRIEQSVASKHLGLLRSADLVQSKREGQKVYYFINYERLSRLSHCAGAFEQ